MRELRARVCRQGGHCQLFAAEPLGVKGLEGGKSKKNRKGMEVSLIVGRELLEVRWERGSHLGVRRCVYFMPNLS